jgi:hypothetical protein
MITCPICKKIEHFAKNYKQITETSLNMQREVLAELQNDGSIGR